MNANHLAAAATISTPKQGRTHGLSCHLSLFQPQQLSDRPFPSSKYRRGTGWRGRPRTEGSRSLPTGCPCPPQRPGAPLTGEPKGPAAPRRATEAGDAASDSRPGSSGVSAPRTGFGPAHPSPPPARRPRGRSPGPPHIPAHLAAAGESSGGRGAAAAALPDSERPPPRRHRGRKEWARPSARRGGGEGGGEGTGDEARRSRGRSRAKGVSER